MKIRVGGVTDYPLMSDNLHIERPTSEIRLLRATSRKSVLGCES